MFLNRLKKRDYNYNFVYKIEGEFENNKIVKAKVTKRIKDNKDNNLNYNNFELFNGEFENNKMKKGVYNFTDKLKYEGEIFNNNCHGKGKFINSFDNLIYI